MQKLAKVQIMAPNLAAEKVDDLLVFDAVCLDVQSRQELLRLMPKLVHIRTARKDIFRERGCDCSKPDPTIAIAARLRRQGMCWEKIYEAMGLAPRCMTREERKSFEQAVRWKWAHLDAPERRPSLRYGAGGMCDRCYLRLRRELAKRLRKMHEGRDADSETRALSLKFDVAQWLLGQDDE
jgi:hypothetical protein